MGQEIFDWNTGKVNEGPTPSVEPHTQITEAIYVGNYLAAKDGEFLSANKIRTVVCLHGNNSETENARLVATKLGITFYDYPLIDGNGNSQQIFDRAVGAVRAGIANGNVLVSCWAGRSRSVVVAAAAIVGIEQITSEEAIRKIGEKREIAISDGLLPLIYNHQEGLPNGGVDLSVENVRAD